MRLVFLVDVDGTIADLAKGAFSALHAILLRHRPERAKKLEGEILKRYEELLERTSDPRDREAIRKAGYNFLKDLFRAARGVSVEVELREEHVNTIERFIRALGSGDAKLAERAFHEVLYIGALRELIRERVAASLYPEALPFLRELRGNGDVILFSRTFHPLVRMLADHIRREHGIDVKALGGAYNALGTGWVDFKEIAAETVLPGGRDVRRVFLDNPDVPLPKDAKVVLIRGKEDLRKVLEGLPEIVRELRRPHLI